MDASEFIPSVARLGLLYPFKIKKNYISNKVRVCSKKGCLGIYSDGGEVGAYIMVKLCKGKLSRNDNDEKKNCGRNHSQKSSPRGMYNTNNVRIFY
jgi:hypothetical protein